MIGGGGNLSNHRNIKQFLGCGSAGSLGLGAAPLSCA